MTSVCCTKCTCVFSVEWVKHEIWRGNLLCHRFGSLFIERGTRLKPCLTVVSTRMLIRVNLSVWTQLIWFPYTSSSDWQSVCKVFIERGSLVHNLAGKGRKQAIAVVYRGFWFLNCSISLTFLFSSFLLYETVYMTIVAPSIHDLVQVWAHYYDLYSYTYICPSIHEGHIAIYVPPYMRDI